MNHNCRLEVAIEAIRHASIAAEDIRNNLVIDSIMKNDRSPVTAADFAVQAIVNKYLGESFPDEPVIAEEKSSELRTTGGQVIEQAFLTVRNQLSIVTIEQLFTLIDHAPKLGAGRSYWTIDPIDGTKGFLRGDQYALALAYIDDWGVQLGVLGCPYLPSTLGVPLSPRGHLYFAVRGEGCWSLPLGKNEQPRRIGIEDNQTGSNCFVESFESAHTDQDSNARIAAALRFTRPPIRMDSQCKYALVARGDAAIYLRLPLDAHYREKIWDHAAGQIVIEEAGGIVSDIHGARLDYSTPPFLAKNTGVVASKAELYPDLIKAITKNLERLQ